MSGVAPNSQPRSILGANFVWLTATGVGNLIPPAANTNGLILRSISVGSAGTSIFLYAGTKVPAGLNDTSMPAIALLSGPDFVGLPFELPPGIGLYYATGTGTVALCITYDLK